MTPRTAYRLAGLTVLAGLAVLSGVPVLTVAGGLPLGLVLPGVALSALLSGRPDRLVAVERIMLVPVLSLGTLVFGGLLAWVVRAPLHRATWVVLTAGVTLAGLAAVALRERRTADGPATDAGSGSPAVRDRTRLPTPADPALVLPVFLDREGLFAPQPLDRRRRRIRHWLPGGLAVLMLAGAAGLSLVSSIRTDGVTATTLSVVPPGAAGPGGDRSIQVNAGGLAAGVAYTLVVTTATGTANTRVPVTGDETGGWTSTLRLPADDRLTLALYRAGGAAALRTVIVASAATG